MDKQYSKDEISNAVNESFVQGINYGKALAKREAQEAYLAKKRAEQKAKAKAEVQLAEVVETVVPVVVEAPALTKEEKLELLNCFDKDKNIGHMESENALAGLTTAKFIVDKDRAGWFLERVSESTKLTYIMPYKINTHAVSTLLKIVQMYKKSGNLNGELVTSYSALAKTSDYKTCRDSIKAIKDDLEALASATIKGEEFKNKKEIKWAGERAFLHSDSVNDGLKITLAPRIVQSLEQNWSFTRIDLNMRNQLSSVSQDLHLFISSWLRLDGQKIKLDNLVNHVFPPHENESELWRNRSRVKKALEELESKDSFKHKLEKMGKITMVSIWK